MSLSNTEIQTCQLRQQSAIPLWSYSTRRTTTLPSYKLPSYRTRHLSLDSLVPPWEMTLGEPPLLFGHNTIWLTSSPWKLRNPNPPIGHDIRMQTILLSYRNFEDHHPPTRNGIRWLTFSPIGHETRWLTAYGESSPSHLTRHLEHYHPPFGNGTSMTITLYSDTTLDSSPAIPSDMTLLWPTPSYQT